MRYFLLLFVLTIVGVVSICGLQGSHSSRPPIELFPDMVRQNKVRPQTPSEFFPDEHASRLIPAGTVPRGGPYVVNGEELKIDGQPVYPYEDSPVNTGRIVEQPILCRSIRCPSRANYSSAASSVTRSTACPATDPPAMARALPANTA